jgi:hypothetical protein
MEDIFQRLVELNKEITYKFGTEAYDIRCKLYDIIQDGRKKVNNGVLDDVIKCDCELERHERAKMELDYNKCMDCKKQIQ